MCNACGINAQLNISATPIEINFTAIFNKNGKLRRSSDFAGKQLFDIDDFTNNLDKITITCGKCGNPVNLSELKVVKSCTLCDSAEIFDCAYNQMAFCLECARKNLTYCRVCPLRQDCKLGGLNDSSIRP